MSALRCKRALSAITAGALAIAVSGCNVSLQGLPKLGRTSQSTYPIAASFANVLNLPADGQVREGTEVVGQIKDIAVNGFSAKVILGIDKGVKVPYGTTAEVRFDDPLGDEYVVLTPPPAGGAPMPPGSFIGQADTHTAPSVEDALGALATVLNGGAVGALGTIVRELNAAFDGNQSEITGFLQTIDVATRSVNGDIGGIDGTLSAISNLFTQLNSGNQVIVQGIQSITPAIGELAGENGEFGQLLTGLTNLSNATLAVTNQSGQDTINSIKALLPVVQQLDGVEASLGADLADLSGLEQVVTKVTPSNYVQASLTLNAEVNSAPEVASAGGVSGSAAVKALVGGGLR